MKLAFAILLGFVLVVPGACAKTFGILACGDYEGTKYDIDNGDASYFKQTFAGKGECSFDLRDFKVFRKSFTPDKKVDYLYFTGHGSNGVAVPSSEERVKQADIGKTDKVAHLVFASCLTVDTNVWMASFGGGLKTILGYRDTSFDIRDNIVARDIAKAMVKHPVSASEVIVDAWMYANSSAGMGNRWTGLGYADSDNSLCFWKPSGKKNEGARSAAPVESYADGRVNLMFPLEASSRALIPQDQGRNGSSGDKLYLSGPENLDVTQMPVSTLEGELETYPSGGLIYRVYGSGSTGNAPERGSDFSADEDEDFALASAFVQENGGIPVDASLASVSPLTQTSRSGEKVIGHIFIWERNLDGSPVAGTAGDGITVIVKNSGIRFYYRLWRKFAAPITESGRSQLPVLDLATAFNMAAGEIARSLKGPSISFVSADRGYHSPGIDSSSFEYVPVYILKTSDGISVSIEMTSGRLLH